MQRDIEIVREEVRQVVSYLRANCPDLEDDEQAWIDTIEGESSLMEVAAKVVERVTEVESMCEAIGARQAALRERKTRFDNQVEALRGALVILMGEAGVKKLELAEATVSLRDVKPKPVITDEGIIPENLWKIKKSPDLTAIKKAWDEGQEVPGTAMDNGRSSVTIRRT